MREILVSHTYIKIITFVENWKGTKIYQSHCIMLNEKCMKDDIKRFVDYVQVHFPSIVSVELIENTDYGKK